MHVLVIIKKEYAHRKQNRKCYEYISTTCWCELFVHCQARPIRLINAFIEYASSLGVSISNEASQQLHALHTSTCGARDPPRDFTQCASLSYYNSPFSLEHCGHGDKYGIAEDQEEEVEDLYGDECIMESAENFVSLFQFITPTLHPMEVLQWTSLWLIGCAANENSISGLASGEQMNWAYTLRARWEVPNRENEPFLPRLFRVLHRDSSRECVCHGEVGLFVARSDPVALLPLEGGGGGLPAYLTPLALGSYTPMRSHLLRRPRPQASWPGNSSPPLLRRLPSRLYSSSTAEQR